MSTKPRAAFMGSPDFAVPSLRATAAHTDLVLVVSQPDRPAGRGRKLAPPAVKVAAEALGVPVIQPTRLRDGVVAAQLRDLDLDLIVVTAYGRILPPAILEVPRRGCVNVHASLLPRWRGAAPIQRAVLAGDRETGVAIMQMEEGLDTGPVYMMRSTPIGAGETSGELFERLAILGGDLLAEFLRAYPDLPTPTPQDDALATHAPMLRKEEGVTAWDRPAAAVVAHVLGMDPWPGATSRRGDDDLKLFRAAISARSGEAEGGDAPPGTVLGVDAEGLHVVCGDGAVVIAEVQPPGKRRMPASAYAAGRAFAGGERLG
ncbi:MAG: methionyl-tRNA formyltransferase [Myxococcales bacterium]|nr:methionyl-tRNA formyltransferase [Myxococcales bacterium]